MHQHRHDLLCPTTYDAKKSVKQPATLIQFKAARDPYPFNAIALNRATRRDRRIKRLATACDYLLLGITVGFLSFAGAGMTLTVLASGF